MKTPIFVMRDQLTGYMNPFTLINEAVAIRDFKIIINDKTQKFYFNPSHFDLYKIGEFDSETGEISSIEPTIVITGLSVKETEDGI